MQKEREDRCSPGLKGITEFDINWYANHPYNTKTQGKNNTHQQAPPYDSSSDAPKTTQSEVTCLWVNAKWTLQQVTLLPRYIHIQSRIGLLVIYFGQQ